jgi:hypothetical protein
MTYGDHLFTRLPFNPSLSSNRVHETIALILYHPTEYKHIIDTSTLFMAQNIKSLKRQTFQRY